MKVIKIISDIHISDELLETNYQLDDNHFISYLKKAIDSSDHFIFNGDIFELWETSFPFIKKWKFKKIMRRRSKLFKFIHSQLLQSNDKVLYIWGNHDNYLRRKNIFPNICQAVTIDYFDRSIHVEHGHLFDSWNSTFSILSEFFTWLGAWTDRLFFYNIDSKIISKIFRKKSTLNLNSKIWEKFDIVVSGHTHEVLHKIGKNKKVYLSTGKCCTREDIIDETTITIYENGDIKTEQNKIRV